MATTGNRVATDDSLRIIEAGSYRVTEDVVDVSVSLTGSSSTSAAGAVVAVGGSVAVLTGLESTGSVGSVVAAGGAVYQTTGVSAGSETGAVYVTAGGNVSVPVLGASSASEVGTVSLAYGYVVSATGVEGTPAVGDAVASAVYRVYATGVSATSDVGTAVALMGALVTGVSSTADVGSVTIIGAEGQRFAENGDARVTESGTARDTEGVVNLSTGVLGASASTAVGTVRVGTFAIVEGLEATGSVGDVSALGTLVGVEATGGVGDVILSAGMIVEVTGVEVATYISRSNFWLGEDGGGTAAWNAIPVNNNTWTAAAAVSGAWTRI